VAFFQQAGHHISAHHSEADKPEICHQSLRSKLGSRLRLRGNYDRSGRIFAHLPEMGAHRFASAIRISTLGGIEADLDLSSGAGEAVATR